MNRKPIVVLTILFCLFTADLSLQSAVAQDKLKLSEAIQEMINSEGVEAAKEYFSGLDASGRSRYSVDTDRISELTNAYLEEGDMEALIAVSEISAPFIQDMVTKSMEQYAPEMLEKAEQRRAEREQEEKQRAEESEQRRQEQIVEFQGESRDDLERFKGLYGDPEAENPNRQLFVTVSCDGYLVSGAMWGDVAPWWMRPEGDQEFSYEDSFTQFRIEFTTDASGKATGMSHDLEFLSSPLERTGPIPSGWDSCMERMER